MKVVGLISGGKDSVYNLLLCQNFGHEVVALANLLPSEDTTDELDSFMYQTVGHQLIEAYGQCTGLPLFRRRISGASKHQELNYAVTEGDEVEDLLQLLAFVKQEIPEVEAVSSGAIASDYQRLRVEHVCSRLGLVSLAYMWMQPQEVLLHGMITAGIEAVLVKVAALGLKPHKHLGKSLQEMQPILRSLNRRFGCNVCGEGGEYETLCLDSPLFTHGRVVLDSWEPLLHSPDQVASVGLLHPTAFHVQPKNAGSCQEADTRLEHADSLRCREGKGVQPDLQSSGQPGGAVSYQEAAVPAEAAAQFCEAGSNHPGSEKAADGPGGIQGGAGTDGTANAVESLLAGETSNSQPAAKAALTPTYSSERQLTGSPADVRQNGSPKPAEDGLLLLHGKRRNQLGDSAAAGPLCRAGTVVMVPDGFRAPQDPFLPENGQGGCGEGVFCQTDVHVWQGHSFVHASCAPKVGGSSVKQAETALHAALTAVAEELSTRGCHLQDALFVQLYLANMAHFEAVNAVYKRHFPQVRPAARACVQAPLPSNCPVAVDVLLPRTGVADRRVLHVQSISCWAPSCIGPYSQATGMHDLVFFAGQIGLEPPTMQLMPSLSAQVQRCFASCQAVAVSMQADLSSDLLGATLYSSAEGGVGAWHDLYCGLNEVLRGISVDYISGSDNEESTEDITDAYLRVSKRPRHWQPLKTYLVMPALPRGALVEVQPLTSSDRVSGNASPSSSDDEGVPAWRPQQQRAGWTGLLRNEQSLLQVPGVWSPLQRNFLVADKLFCCAQLSWPMPTTVQKLGRNSLGQEELEAVIRVAVDGLQVGLKACGLMQHDTVSLRLYYKPELLRPAEEMPEIQAVMDSALSAGEWEGMSAVCVPVLEVGWCADYSVAVQLDAVFWATS